MTYGEFDIKMKEENIDWITLPKHEKLAIFFYYSLYSNLNSNSSEQSEKP